MSYPRSMNFNQSLRKSLILVGSSLVILATLLIAGCSTASDNSSNQSSSQSNTPQSRAQSSPEAGAHQHPQQASNPQNRAAAAPTPRIPAFFENPEAAKPLPKVLDPAQFRDPIVSKAYYLAQLNSDLFAQQPCYCYCDAGHGHRSLLDCFTSDHGAGCMLCMKEGYFIDKMHKQGKSASEIRDLIVRGDWQTVSLE